MSARTLLPGGPCRRRTARPEHDPRARRTALEPDYTAALAARLVASGRTAEVRSPLDDAPLAHVPQSTVGDVVGRSRGLGGPSPVVADLPGPPGAVLLRLHDLILDRRDEIIDLIQLESGKARKHAFDEPLHVALTAATTAARRTSTLDSKRRIGVIPGLTRVDQNHVPKGVVGIISPWNPPSRWLCATVSPRSGRQHAVVAKPDAQTMLSALLAAELLEQAGFPARPCGGRRRPGPDRPPPSWSARTTSASTGSTATGRLIARRADQLIGCSLENSAAEPPPGAARRRPGGRPRVPCAPRSRTPASSASRWSGVFVADQV